MERSLGLFFPLVISEGTLVYPGLEDSIDSSLRILFSWTYSKRYFNPAFGTKLESILHRGVTDEVLFALKMEITRVIEEWEPRLSSLKVTLRAEGSSVKATVNAQIPKTKTTYTFETIL